MATTSDPATQLIQAHRQAIRATAQEATDAILGVLSRRLLAYMVDVDVRTVSRWAAGETADLRDGHDQRLRAVAEIILLLGAVEAPATISSWFLGLNPLLDDGSPAEAIHAGRLTEALGAASAFLALG
jgi:hypothetical protein